jgi:hypothetical protein
MSVVLREAIEPTSNRDVLQEGQQPIATPERNVKPRARRPTCVTSPTDGRAASGAEQRVKRIDEGSYKGRLLFSRRRLPKRTRSCRDARLGQSTAVVEGTAIEGTTEQAAIVSCLQADLRR